MPPLWYCQGLTDQTRERLRDYQWLHYNELVEPPEAARLVTLHTSIESLSEIDKIMRQKPSRRRK